MTKFKYINALFLLFFSLVVFSCQKDEEAPNYFHKVEPITKIEATFASGSEEIFTTTQEHPFPDTIRINFPFYYPEESEELIDITKMKLHLEINEEATMTTKIPEVVDLTKPLKVEFINADKSKQEYVIIGNVRKNNQARITSFAIESASLTGIIVESDKKIGIDRTEKDLSNASAAITISPGATISPDPSTKQNFNEAVVYTVKAQDGTEVKYTVDDINLINKFEIGKGVNIASWISTPKYSGAKRVAFFNEQDVKLLSEAGFDHIRLCIDEVELWDNNGMKIYPYGFNLVHDAIKWCMKYNMRILIDLHSTRNHRFTNSENLLFTDPNEPAKFVKLWQDFSSELSKYPNSVVAYELLNEPVSQNPENWNRVSALAIDAIRELEPFRTIIVGVCAKNGSAMYNDFKLPDAENLLMTFHYYGPFLLTAYGLQSTTGGRTDLDIQYPGRLIPEEKISFLPANWQETGRRTYTKDRLEESIMQGINRAKQLNVPVFVGEFGTLKTVPEPSRTNWYRDVVDIYKKHNTPYTSWDYKGAGYSIVGEDYSILYPSILNVLTN